MLLCRTAVHHAAAPAQRSQPFSPAAVHALEIQFPGSQLQYEAPDRQATYLVKRLQVHTTHRCGCRVLRLPELPDRVLHNGVSSVLAEW